MSEKMIDGVEVDYSAMEEVSGYRVRAMYQRKEDGEIVAVIEDPSVDGIKMEILDESYSIVYGIADHIEACKALVEISCEVTLLAVLEEVA
jgi:hypothetical protein